MSSMRMGDALRSVAFRLTVWYTLLFGCVLLGGGVLLYYRGAARILQVEDADLASELRERLTAFAHDDVDRLRSSFAAEPANLAKGDYIFRLLTIDGRTQAVCGGAAWKDVPVDLGGLLSLAPGTQRLQTLSIAAEHTNLRLLTARISQERVVQIGLSMADNDRFLRHLLDTATAIFVGMLAFGAIIGWSMARRAMAGVEGVTAAASRIAEGHFDERVQVFRAGTEIEHLGRTFNRMVERLQTLMREMQQVNDNIAHDLRSPITCIRGLAEAAAVRPQSPAEALETAGSIIEECDHLLGLINTMLDIAEAEAGIRAPDCQEVPLADIVNRAVELFQAVAEARGIRLDRVIAAEPVVRADVRKIQRALANLLDNALKYTGAGGQVTVTLSRQGGSAVVAVRDTGVGIAASELPRIFKRFYRVDGSRHLPGSGLGLSLAAAVVRAHGGTLTVESTLGSGSTFTMALPGTEPAG